MITDLRLREYIAVHAYISERLEAWYKRAYEHSMRRYSEFCATIPQDEWMKRIGAPKLEDPSMLMFQAWYLRDKESDKESSVVIEIPDEGNYGACGYALPEEVILTEDGFTAKLPPETYVDSLWDEWVKGKEDRERNYVEEKLKDVRNTFRKWPDEVWQIINEMRKDMASDVVRDR